jgi:hypothetical protein
VLQVLHWFNPLVWFGFSRMRADRELACDALALAHLGKVPAESYGETIIKVVENLVRPPRARAVLALSADKRQLQERMRMIAAYRGRPGRSIWALSLVAVIAAFGLTDASRGRPVTSPALRNAAEFATTAGSGEGILQKGIRGRVVDAEGKPIADVKVSCQEFAWSKSTDTDGRFVWPEADQARTFQIAKSGFKSLVTSLLVPGADDTVLRLEHEPMIGGKVIDHETGQPIASFEVYHVQLLHGPMIPSLDMGEPVQGKSGVFKYPFDYFFWPDSAFYIDAEGYKPVLSRPLTIADDGKQLAFELTRAQSVAGKVVTPEGTPASKAEVRLWCGQPNIRDIPRRHKTDADIDGAFSLPPALDGQLVVYHQSGYAEVPWKEFVATHTVQLVNWGHVKGRWPKPLPKNRSISLQRIDWSGQGYTRLPPWDISAAEVSYDGSFEFKEAVPPGEYKLKESSDLIMNWPYRGFWSEVLLGNGVPVLVEPGRTTTIEVPAGRSVIGRIDFGDGQTLTNIHLPIVRLSLKQQGPKFVYPGLDTSLSAAANFEQWKEYKQRVLNYWLSEEGKARRRMERIFELPTQPDGSFRIDHVTPGTYELLVNPERFAVKSGPQFRREISIPPSTEETPLDLGVLTQQPRAKSPTGRPSSKPLYYKWVPGTDGTPSTKKGTAPLTSYDTITNTNDRSTWIDWPVAGRGF